MWSDLNNECARADLPSDRCLEQAALVNVLREQTRESQDGAYAYKGDLEEALSRATHLQQQLTESARRVTLMGEQLRDVQGAVHQDNQEMQRVSVSLKDMSLSKPACCSR